MSTFEKPRPDEDPFDLDDFLERKLSELAPDIRMIVFDYVTASRDGEPSGLLQRSFTEAEQEHLRQADQFKIDTSSQNLFVNTCLALIEHCELQEDASKKIAFRLEYQIHGVFRIAFEHLAMFHDDEARFSKGRVQIQEDSEIPDQIKIELVTNLRKSFSPDSYNSFNSDSVAVAMSLAIQSSIEAIHKISGFEKTRGLNFLTHYVDHTIEALLIDLESQIVAIRDYVEPKASTNRK